MLIGNLTRDPILRTTQSGVSVCSFVLAVNRRHKAEGQPEADFFNITAWRERGENCARYLAKGRKCAVTGEVHLRQYEASDGTKHTSVDVVAEDVEFLPDGARRAKTDFAEQGHSPAYEGFAEADSNELLF